MVRHCNYCANIYVQEHDYCKHLFEINTYTHTVGSTNNFTTLTPIHNNRPNSHRL